MKAETLLAGICSGKTLRAVATQHQMSISGVFNSLKRAGLPTNFFAAKAAGLVAADEKFEQLGKAPVAIRSWAGYASVLRELQRRPETVHAMADRLGCSYFGLQHLMTRMCDLGLVHEAAWVNLGRGGQDVPLWAFGKAGRTPSPHTGRLPVYTRSGHRHRPLLIAFAHVMRELANEPTTLLQLAERTGCQRNNLGKLMAHCEAIGLAWVSGWDVREDGAGKPAAVWALSDQVRARARRPAVASPQELSQRNNQKRRARARMLRLVHAMVAPRAPAELEAA